MGRLIGGFDTKRGHEQIRVYVMDENGKTSISVRTYSYRNGDWHPTKNGVSVPRSKVYKLIKLIEKAADLVSNHTIQNAEAA